MATFIVGFWYQIEWNDSGSLDFKEIIIQPSKMWNTQDWVVLLFHHYDIHEHYVVKQGASYGGKPTNVLPTGEKLPDENSPHG